MYSYSISRPIAQYDSEDNTDVIFLVGEDPDIQRIPAHTWILVEKSPVFRAMFKGPLSANSIFSNQAQSSNSSNQINSQQGDKGFKDGSRQIRSRHRSLSGTSFDKSQISVSSLSTIPDNEDEEQALLGN